MQGVGVSELFIILIMGGGCVIIIGLLVAIFVMLRQRQ